MPKGRVPKKHIGKPPTPPKKCVACNGSGYYDAGGSHRCAACNGSGLWMETCNGIAVHIPAAVEALTLAERKLSGSCSVCGLSFEETATHRKPKKCDYYGKQHPPRDECANKRWGAIESANYWRRQSGTQLLRHR